MKTTSRASRYVPIDPPFAGSVTGPDGDPNFHDRRWKILLLLLLLFLLIVVAQVAAPIATGKPFMALSFVLPELIVGRMLRYAMLWYCDVIELSCLRPEEERFFVTLARVCGEALKYAILLKTKEMKRPPPKGTRKPTAGAKEAKPAPPTTDKPGLN